MSVQICPLGLSWFDLLFSYHFDGVILWYISMTKGVFNVP